MPRLAEAFFVARRGERRPLVALHFGGEERIQQTKTNKNNDDEEGKSRRLVEFACKGCFCFPEEEEEDDDEGKKRVGGESTVTNEDATYSFGLTDQDGERFYGFVQRRGNDEAFVVLSGKRYFSLFHRVLSVVVPHRDALLKTDKDNAAAAAERLVDAESDVGSFLVSTLGQNVGEHQHEIVVPSPNSEPDLRIKIPKNENVEDIECFDALSEVSTDAIIALLVSLFFERRVVLTSASLSKVSRATHAANRMVFPLKWEHVFLPLVPMGLLEYLTAPMPFLVGLPLASMAAYEKLPKEEVFLLNLDDGSYTHFEEDFEILPRRISNRLQRTLENERKNKIISSPGGSGASKLNSVEIISKAFRRFISSAIGSYPRFVKSVALEKPPPEAITSDGLWLDQDAFIEGAQTHRMGLFRISLRHTQMYEVYVRKRLVIIAEAARRGKAQFGIDVKDKDLDGTITFVPTLREISKEARSVYRDAQKMAKVSALSIKKGAKSLKDKFNAFARKKEKKTTTALSTKPPPSQPRTLASSPSSSPSSFTSPSEIVSSKNNSAETGIYTQIVAADSEVDEEDEDEDEEDDDTEGISEAERASALKKVAEKASLRRAMESNQKKNLIDFFEQSFSAKSGQRNGAFQDSEPIPVSSVSHGVSLLDL